MTKDRLPFRNLTTGAWQNLAIAAVVLVYLAQVVLDIAWGNLFGNIGVDFAAFWSAGHIANQEGYGVVYDLETLAEIQRQFMPRTALVPGVARILPTAYLPIFLVPFQVLALLPPAPAAAVWMALNLLGSLLYLRHFAMGLGERGRQARWLRLLMISVPIFQNIFLGQANLWLMICVGESILAHRSGREFRSGAWLAGLLLKPQCLLLIAPAVLLQRRWRTAAGMLLAGAAILFSSWFLAGAAALLALSRLWLGYVGGLPTNDPQLMMNWRMIGVHLQGLVGSDWARAMTLAGMAVTIIAALVLSLRRFEPSDDRTTIVMLGVVAATALVSWHSHVHMAMILIPPLLALARSQESSSIAILRWWVWLPATFYVLRIVLAALARAAILPGATFGLVDLMGGLGLFLVNVILVVWSLRRLAPPSSAVSRLPA